MHKMVYLSLICCHSFPLPCFLHLCCSQTFVNGQLRLEGRQEKGQGKCPFDPFQRYSSLMVGECLHQDSKGEILVST